MSHFMDSKTRTSIRSLCMPDSNESDPWLGGFGLTRWLALIIATTMLEFREADGHVSGCIYMCPELDTWRVGNGW